MAITGKEIEALLEELKRGHCWCEKGVGNPTVPEHSIGCNHASSLLVNKPWQYNGHPNYESWVTGLWLTNDEPQYNQVRTLLYNQVDPDEEDPRKIPLAQERALKDFLEASFNDIWDLVERQPNLSYLDRRWEWGLIKDLFGYALGGIDYSDLIQGFIEE